MPSSTAFSFNGRDRLQDDLSTNQLSNLPTDDIVVSSDINATDWFFEADEIINYAEMNATTVSLAAKSPSQSSCNDTICKSPLIQQVLPFSITKRNVPISELVAEWQGVVTEIEDEDFIAQMRGTFGAGVAGNLEEALIPINDVNPGDIDLLKPGAFFRLCISYEIAPAGSRRRYTEVIFRRLPAYRREELEAARSKAADLVRDLRVE